jgi:ribosomal protein S18 acetylase RimI-like enzyme
VSPVSGFHVEPLGRDHDRTAFSCEAPSLERYLKEQAGQDARKNVAAPFVLLSAEGQIAGYYTLSATILRSDDLPPELLRKLKLPRYPELPATPLGRLARHSSFRGQGIGELLLLDALRRAFRMSTEIASLAVIVDAKDERACGFYRDYGFVAFPASANRLFLRMETIGQLFSGVSLHGR